MDNFQIETAQNVNIQQDVATIWDRMLAFLIDLLVIFTVEIILSIILSATGEKGMGQWTFMTILGLPPFLYHLLFETFMNGQSLGKAALRIRVVKLDGSKAAFSNYLIRWLLRIIDISLTSGSLAVVVYLFNGKGQRLGDIAAGTTVISEKAKVFLQQTVLVDLPEDYQPAYPQVTVFSDKEIQHIKTIYGKAKREANHKIILSLSEKVSGTMEVTPTESPLIFIEKVIQDYNYYTQLQ